MSTKSRLRMQTLTLEKANEFKRFMRRVGNKVSLPDGFDLDAGLLTVDPKDGAARGYFQLYYIDESDGSEYQIGRWLVDINAWMYDTPGQNGIIVITKQSGQYQDISRSDEFDSQALDALVDSIESEIENYMNGTEVISSMKILRKGIRASAELPENYSDMGYDNLDFALEAWESAQAAADILFDRITTTKANATVNEDPIECFRGPEDAEAFGKKMYELSSKLDKIANQYYKLLEQYTTFFG